MDTEKDALRKDSLTSKKMEKSVKSKESSSKVKLKVVKKKVHIRQGKGLNRSNNSFNSSLNASTKMKQTLRSNNRALAHALQIAKQDLSLATNIISSLRLDNRNLMLEAGNNKYMASHCLEEQVGARLKPVLMMIKQKVSDVGKHLTIVTSTVQEISESIASYLSTSAGNSRSNSLEIGQNMEETPTESPNEKVLLKNIVGNEVWKKNVNSQICNDLSLIAESFINMDYTSNTLDVLSKVDELESEKLCKSDNEDQHLNVPVDEPKTATKSQPNVKTRSSIEIRRQSLNEIDFGTTLPASRKKRRSSFFLPATGLDMKLHQQLDTLEPSVIKDSCAEEVNLENPAVKDSNTLLNRNSCEPSDSGKIVKSNSGHVPCTDVSKLNNKTAETALVDEHDDSILNSAIPNSTMTDEVDMELTEIINNTDVINVSSQNIPTTNDAHPTDINLEKQKDMTVAKDDFIKPTKVAKKVNPKCNKKSKSSKDKKEDEKVKCTETDGNENKAVIELRLPKPGKIIFSATRKNFSGIRPSPPKVRSKRKINAEKKEKEEPKSLFDFHDKTPQLLNKKDIKPEGIYNVSLNDSAFGKCQNLGQYRERVAMAKEKKKEEVSDVKDNSEKIIDDNQTVSRISNECNEEKMKPSQTKKSLTKDPAVTKGKSRSRKKVNDDDDYENVYNKLCKTDVPQRTLTRRTRSKVVSYAEIDESFDTSVIKPITAPNIDTNCQKTTKAELVGSEKIDGSCKKSENSKITNKNILKQDSETVASIPCEDSKVNISECSNSNSLSTKATMNELHKTQKHLNENKNIEKGIVSSSKPSSSVSDLLERYRKALVDDDVSSNVPLKRRGRSSSQIKRVSFSNSATKNAKIDSSQHRSRSVSSVDAVSNNSGRNSCDSDEKMHSDLWSTKIVKEKRQSRSSNGKIGELEQEINRKSIKSHSTKSHKNVPEKTEQKNSREKTPDLINVDSLKMKKNVQSKVKGKVIFREMKENMDLQLTNLTPEATSRNTSPSDLSKNYSKRLPEDNYEDASGVKRPRRAVIKSMSYREPTLKLKLRQGDELFVSKSLEKSNFVCKDEEKKRHALENVTNMN